MCGVCVCVLRAVWRQDGTEHVVKEVPMGDSIHSLLSMMDVLTVSAHTRHVYNFVYVLVC